MTSNDAAVPPNLTTVVPVKPVPVMVTLVPPVAGPLEGKIDAIAGGGRMKLPNAAGPLPTAMVAITVLLAVAMTETVLSPLFAT